MNEKVLKPLKENGIDWNTFGEYLYHKRVINERNTKANPDGWTAKLSSERMSEMQKELGNSFQVMETASNDFWEIRKDTIIKAAQESKMFSEALIEKMTDNENYVTFDVVKFIDKEHGSGTGARIYQQVGTLEKIRNPATATMAKDMAILRSIEWNNTKRLTCSMFQRFFPDKIQDAEKRFVNNHHEYIQKNTGDTGTVTYMLNGKVQSFYLDREIADVFERQSKFAMGFYAKGLMYSADVFRTLFTQIKVGFTLANFIRDFQRTVKNLPGYKVIYQILPKYIKALPEAWHSTANELTPVVSEMLQNNMLISVADTRNLNSLDTQIERMVATWNVTARERFNEMPIYQKIPSLLLWYSVRAGRTVERVSKIAGYLYLKDYHPDASGGSRTACT